jgi:hypothetical protein
VVCFADEDDVDLFGVGSAADCGSAGSLAVPAIAWEAPATIGVGGELVPAVEAEPDCALGISPVITAMPTPQKSVTATPATMTMG